MTKPIKVILIALGFVILLIIKISFKQIGVGILWPIMLLVYLAFSTAIWKYNTKSEKSDKLDKNN